MRQKSLVIMLLAVSYIVLTALYGWAAPPSDLASKAGSARGVAYYIMGYNAELQDESEEAARFYERSVQADGSSSLVRMRLATVYAQLGRFADSLRSAERAVWLDPKDLSARYFLALLYAQQKMDDKSAAEYEYIFKGLAEKDPKNGEYPLYLGQLYYSQGKESQAMEQFALALKYDAQNTSLLYILGSYYLDDSRQDDGVALLKQCLVVDAKNAECLNALAYAYAEDRVNLEEALKLINKALIIEPNNAAYLDTRGWVNYQQGKYPLALQDLKKADAIIKDPEILEHMVQVYIKLGSSAEAQKVRLEKEQLIHVDKKEGR